MIVATSAPYEDGSNAGYRAYRKWLLETFFEHLCSYCLLQDEGVEVDHYEPRKYASFRLNDPTNLLLACGRCNGRSGKSDYHPFHSKRVRLPADATGFLVLDVRIDDFAQLFELSATTGDISPRRREPTFERAAWNIELLKLNLPFVSNARKEIIDLRDSCQIAIESLGDDRLKRSHDQFALLLKKLIEVLRPRVLLLDVFGIEVSPELRRCIDALRPK